MNELKQLLWRIAHLSKRHQKTLLGQLSAAQYALLTKHQGLTQLDEAQKFRHLPLRALANNSQQLPAFYDILATKSPLCIAIILEQGAYPSEKYFLQQTNMHEIVKEKRLAELPFIKSAVKKALFQDIMQQANPSISFETHLDDSHG